MKNVLLKDALRTIERTYSRFISMAAIVALGISFFAGMNATAPDMLDTVWDYYKDTNAMDIQIVSTAGLTDEDVNVISSIQGIENITGEKFFDGVVKVNGEKISDIDGSELTVRAISLDIEKAINYANGADDRTFLNRPQLIEGTWPTTENQCLVDQSRLSTPEEFQIGSVITIQGSETDAAGSLKNTEYTITGVIRTPLYISYERGRTTVGTGKLGAFVYLPATNFLNDYYNSLSMKLSGTDKLDPYSEKYENHVKQYVDYINSISKECLSSRVTALKNQYSTQVAQNEQEYLTQKEKVDTTIAEAQEQLATILDMAENGDAKLAEYKAQYNEKAAEANSQIDASKLEHSTQYSEWEQKRDKYNEAKALVDKYANAETDLKNAQTEYNVANLQITTLTSTVDYLENLCATTRMAIDHLNETQDNDVSDIINRFETSGLVGAEVDNIIASIRSMTAVGTAEEISGYMEPQLQMFEEKLKSAKLELSDNKTQLASKKIELQKAEELVAKLNQVKAQLVVAEQELSDAEKQLTGANYEIQFGELEVLSQLSDLKNQITSYETNLQIAKEKAKTAQADFDTQKAQAYEELENAKNKLDEAKNFLLSLDSAKWYVNDRNDALYGFEEYGQTAARTAALSKVFPWIFFFVAALVCLNTMTRMVEDERTQLGTLKALGFTNKEIVTKYIVYALAASAIGAFAGTMLGFAIFPFSITSAYGILFDVPAVEIKYRFAYAVPGVLISIATTVLAGVLASYKSLVSVPSTLMRPKSPKGGKRVFLEKFQKLWSLLNFTWKVTLRNVFRNKKRFIMAVVGVMGCTALMVAGFGLQKSINATIEKQFTNKDAILRYDMQIVLNGSYDTTVSDCEALTLVNQRAEIGTATLTYMKVLNTTSAKSKKTMETYIMVPENSDAFSNYILLKDAKSGKQISLEQNGAVITQKLAKELNLSVGDSIEVNLESGNKIGVPVAAIAENYTFHYVYMTKEVYNVLFGANPRYNYITANLATDIPDQQKSQLAQELIGEYSISAVSYAEEIQNMLENALDSLSYIVLVLVVSAGLLSLIVLYNLSSINIHERQKEIATIKVLGFNNKEVDDYIFRENILLGVIGTFFGLFLGILFHRLVIIVGEVDIVMFGRTAGIMAYVYSAILSMAFTFLVNLILKRNLKKIDMVESLKSIE